jgi:hypothetical protein
MVKDVSSVGLWLGADVMLEYPLEEARQLLVRIWAPAFVTLLVLIISQVRLHVTL